MGRGNGLRRLHAAGAAPAASFMALGDFNGKRVSSKELATEAAPAEERIAASAFREKVARGEDRVDLARDHAAVRQRCAQFRLQRHEFGAGRYLQAVLAAGFGGVRTRAPAQLP